MVQPPRNPLNLLDCLSRAAVSLAASPGDAILLAAAELEKLQLVPRQTYPPLIRDLLLFHRLPVVSKRIVGTKLFATARFAPRRVPLLISAPPERTEHRP